jgi:hypothetical protein
MWPSDIDSPCSILAQISDAIKMNELGRKADDIAILVLTLAINISLSQVCRHVSRKAIHHTGCLERVAAHCRLVLWHNSETDFVVEIL